MTDLGERARTWLADDPDVATAEELRRLVEAAERDPGAAADLRQRFAAPLGFGTAGLRAPMGAGPARMNRVTVSRCAAGLAQWMRQRSQQQLVVGYDARTSSDVFARDVAEVAAGAGLSVSMLPRPLPTPVLAYAVRSLEVDAGVMVTASHNPATDNGLKVYLGDGGQVTPPADREIAELMDAAPGARQLPRRATWTSLDDAVVDAYVDDAVRLAPPGPRDLRIAFTPLHGVGGELLQCVLKRGGFGPGTPVREQQEPDPLFSTVASPDPEERGTLDLLLRTADDISADLAVALDPDADRCAVAVPRPSGGWRVLSGDEVGCLLGEQVASQRAAGTLATTLVSSRRLAAIADQHGRPSATTLTGFKWIAHVPDLSYGYEEALGYCLDPTRVADKDGVTAALVVAAVAADLRSRGRTLLDALDDLDDRYGVHETAQRAVRADANQRDAVLSALLSRPPTTLGRLPVVAYDNLGDGVDGLPPSSGVRFRLRGPTPDIATRVVVRPSGTEPKLKAYVEVVVPVGDARSRPAARQLASHLRADVLADLEQHLVTG